MPAHFSKYKNVFYLQIRAVGNRSFPVICSLGSNETTAERFDNIVTNSVSRYNRNAIDILRRLLLPCPANPHSLYATTERTRERSPEITVKLFTWRQIERESDGGIRHAEEIKSLI